MSSFTFSFTSLGLNFLLIGVACVRITEFLHLSTLEWWTMCRLKWNLCRCLLFYFIRTFYNCISLKGTAFLLKDTVPFFFSIPFYLLTYLFSIHCAFSLPMSFPKYPTHTHIWLTGFMKIIENALNNTEGDITNM